MTRRRGQEGHAHSGRGNGDREGGGKVDQFRDMAVTSKANCRASWKVAGSGLSWGEGLEGLSRGEPMSRIGHEFSRLMTEGSFRGKKTVNSGSVYGGWKHGLAGCGGLCHSLWKLEQIT